jgi:hypothetical protein
MTLASIQSLWLIKILASWTVDETWCFLNKLWPEYLSCVETHVISSEKTNSKGKIMSEFSSDTQGFLHREFFPEGGSVNNKMYTDILSPQSGMQWERNSCKNWHKTAGFFCTTPPHNDHWQYLATHNVMTLERPPCSLDLLPPNFFLFLRIKSALKD